MDLFRGLNKCFDVVIASKTEHDFYNNVFSYYDYIFSHPELAKLYENLEINYRKKHMKIWESRDLNKNNDADRRHRETVIMEKFDPYCNACGLEVRVYAPLKRYSDYDDPTNVYDFEAHLLAHGLEYALRNVNVDGISIPPKERKKQIRHTYNAWYKGKREYYQRELSRFHVAFLQEIEKMEGANLSPKGKEIEFDDESSALKVSETKVKISLKNDKPNAHYVLEYMFENDPFEKSSYTEILEEKFFSEGGWRKIYRACSDIQEKVRKQLNTEDFLEFTTGKTGWVRINPRYR